MRERFIIYSINFRFLGAVLYPELSVPMCSPIHPILFHPKKKGEELKDSFFSALIRYAKN
jgi:hypothetical protein